MAKCIYICFRKVLPKLVGMQLQEICKRISPDNITPSEPMIKVNGNVAFGVMNPNSTLTMNGGSLLMGKIFEKDENWSVPLQAFPDGSYALFRDGEVHFEIVSDPVASRTIWYYLDESIFVASTSQRAIVMFIHDFEFNEKVIPWMLSSGILGPSHSWDKRIKCVPPNSSIILNKNEWVITAKTNPIEFNPANISDEQHEELLKESLKTTFKSLDLDYSKWTLPLSGGYDSRGILCMLLETSPDVNQLNTITWGLSSSQEIKGNDALVARELANQLHVGNKYYTNDLTNEPIDTIISRFILLSEGRNDNVSQYMDGLSMWKSIFEEGIQGIIRGDEGFGCKPYSSKLAVRINQSYALCSDFLNLKGFKRHGLCTQELPCHLNQRKGETLSSWCDRLFHEYTLPTEFSALSDLKLSYVEQINPLLSREILHTVRQLPDHLRTGKALFKKIVDSKSPEIGYATSSSGQSPEEILRQKSVVDFLRNELSSSAAKTLFPDEFLDFVLKGMKSYDQKEAVKKASFSLRSYAGKLVPRFIKEALRSKVLLPSVDHNLLAFRVLLISRMYKTLREESNV